MEVVDLISSDDECEVVSLSCDMDNGSLRVEKESCGFRVEKESRSFRVGQELTGYRVQQETPGCRVEQETPGFRVEKESRGFRVKQGSPGNRVQQVLPSYRVEPEYSSNRVQQELPSYHVEPAYPSNCVQQELPTCRVKMGSLSNRVEKDSLSNPTEKDIHSNLIEKEFLSNPIEKGSPSDRVEKQSPNNCVEQGDASTCKKSSSWDRIGQGGASMEEESSLDRNVDTKKSVRRKIKIEQDWEEEDDVMTSTGKAASYRKRDQNLEQHDDNATLSMGKRISVLSRRKRRLDSNEVRKAEDDVTQSLGEKELPASCRKRHSEQDWDEDLVQSSGEKKSPPPRRRKSHLDGDEDWEQEDDLAQSSGKKKSAPSRRKRYDDGDLDDEAKQSSSKKKSSSSRRKRDQDWEQDDAGHNTTKSLPHPHITTIDDDSDEDLFNEIMAVPSRVLDNDEELKRRVSPRGSSHRNQPTQDDDDDALFNEMMSVPSQRTSSYTSQEKDDSSASLVAKSAAKATIKPSTHHDRGDSSLPLPPVRPKQKQCKLAVDIVRGKHRMKEWQACARSSTWTNKLTGLSVWLSENERNQPNINPAAPQNLVYFERCKLVVDDLGQIMASPMKSVGALGLLFWDGIDVVTAVTSNDTHALLKQADLGRRFLRTMQNPSMDKKPANLLVVVVGLSQSLNRSSSNSGSGFEVEDFLLTEVCAGLGMSHTLVKTMDEAMDIAAEAFFTNEDAAYKSFELDFLDTAEKFRSFSSSSTQDENIATQKKNTQRVIDGSQLSQIWLNQLRCLPRVSDSVAMLITERFPSFRNMFEEFANDPKAAADAVTSIKPGRSELKLARTVRALFTSDDPEEQFL